MSSSTTTSRFPFESQISEMPAQHQYVIRNLWNAISDVQSAVPVLKSSIDSKASSTSGTSTTTNVTTSTETVVTNSSSSSGSVTEGAVNNQSGVTSYTIQQSDNAGFVILNDSAAIAVTLDSALTIPYYLWIVNYGTSIATLTPTTGTITYPDNVSAASMPLEPGFAAYIELDGTNWWAIVVPVVGNAVTQIIAGTNVTISPTSGEGAVTVNASGTISGVVAGTGLTGGGTSGSVTISLSTPVSVANGGTGTATPGLVAGSGISITGSWPDQTISSTSPAAANFADSEIVSGSGTSWTLANTPASGCVPILVVQLSGFGGITLLEGFTPGFTISGANITTTSSYSSGALCAWYRY